jgi:hypothetical protein
MGRASPLLRIIKTEQAQDLIAGAAVGISASSAGWAWLSHANELLTTVATIIAIISGLAAIRYHTRKDRNKED